jgi:PAS domain S-box-containing protein
MGAYSLSVPGTVGIPIKNSMPLKWQAPWEHQARPNGIRLIVIRSQLALLAALFLPLVLLVQSSLAMESKETKRVLVLYSEDKHHPAHELTDRGIRETFQSNKRFHVRLYTEYLDLSRFAAPIHRHNVAEYLAGKYAGLEIDAIIAVYPAAMNLLLREASFAFPAVPIVGCSLLRPQVKRLEFSPFRSLLTGIVAGDNAEGVLDAALRMRPRAKHVALIAGTEPNDEHCEQVLRNCLNSRKGKLELIDLTKLPMDDILTRVRSLPADTIILFACLLRDGAGKTFVPREALSTISRAANAPVFGLFDSYLGHGIVGGRLVSFKQQGKVAAKFALRVLSGEAPGSIPFQEGKSYVSLYDWRQLKRWGIPENAVLPGSEIRFRNPSLWEKYGWAIIGLGVALLVETTLIFGLVKNLRRRRKAERSLMESEARMRLAVSSASAGLWTLDETSGLLWATEETRKILGIALNDDLDFEKFLALVHTEDRDDVAQTIQQAFQLGKEVLLEYRIVHPDGAIRWIASRGRMREHRVGTPKLLTGISVDVTVSKEIESDLLQSQQDLSVLAGKLISAQEEERSRVARELHDDLSQRLAVLAIEAGNLELHLGSESAQVVREVAAIKDGLIRISQDIHDLSRQIHPSILEDLGLVKAIQSECTRFLRKEGFKVLFTYEDVPPAYPTRGLSCPVSNYPGRPQEQLDSFSDKDRPSFAQRLGWRHRTVDQRYGHRL